MTDAMPTPRTMREALKVVEHESSPCFHQLKTCTEIVCKCAIQGIRVRLDVLFRKIISKTYDGQLGHMLQGTIDGKFRGKRRALRF
jgi:hypothetical protein